MDDVGAAAHADNVKLSTRKEPLRLDVLDSLHGIVWQRKSGGEIPETGFPGVEDIDIERLSITDSRQ